MYAHKARTPTLNVCGLLDRCTPAEEAMQFHSALLENNVKSVLVSYPQEGHGVRKFPAVIDFAARAVGWFDQHMGLPGSERVYAGTL
jgi:dipeptidyl aminopeptidase/acylaminoacyl peptidase